MVLRQGCRCIFSSYLFFLENWIPLECSGSRPLPRCGHTFTSIDKNRAVVIGGLDSQGPFEDAFIFKLNTRVLLLVHC